MVKSKGKKKEPKDRKDQSELWSRNKNAFDQIIGDPYSKPEPIEGHYATLKSRSSIAIAAPKETSSPEAVNEARPGIVDFFCDVEAAVQDGIKVFSRSWREGYAEALFVFMTTYITEDDGYYKFNQRERSKIEQIVGRIFVERNISPVRRYFTAIRRKHE